MRVLIVRLGSMGDVLHAMPAVAALRAADPDAYIGWAIERRWTPLLVADDTPLSGPRSPQRPLVDHVHVVSTRAWRKAPFSDETWAEVRNVFRDIREQRYDVALDFQGAIKSAVVAQFSGAPTRIGFAQPREKPATMLYTSAVQPTARHVIDQNLALIAALWNVEREVRCENLLLPSDHAAESEIARKLSGMSPATSDERSATAFAILNTGAGWAAKEWPADRYAEVARALQEHGIVAVVNYGPGEEALAREVENTSGGAARPIFCTLAELVELTRRASLFIGGDTGPMHLAAALGVPVLALFGPTDPARNGPYSSNSIVLRHPSSRTDYSHKNTFDPGLLNITAGEVIASARTLLSETRQPKTESRV